MLIIVIIAFSMTDTYFINKYDGFDSKSMNASISLHEKSLPKKLYKQKKKAASDDKNILFKYAEASSSLNYDIYTATQLTAPKISKLVCTTAGVKIVWGKIKGAVKYRLFVKSGKSWVKLADTASVSYVHKAVKSGNTYTYTLRCISKDGKKYTSSFDAKGKSVKYIAAPKITKLENAASGVKLTWGKVNGVSKYRIYVKNGQSWVKLADTTALSYIHKAAKSGVTYTYTLRCLDAKGKITGSYYTSGRKIQFIAMPVVSLANVKGGVKINWKKISGAAKYRIFVKNTNMKWSKLVDVAAVSYIDREVKTGAVYTYTVRCITADGKKYTSAYNTKGVTIKHK